MLSENLKTLRKMKGFSQEEVAARLNVVRQTVSKWEKELSVPDADLLIRIAEVFEVSVSELLGEKIEIEPEANTVAEQLSRINEQLAVSNRRSRRIWKAAAIVAGVAVIVAGTALIASFVTKSSAEDNENNDAFMSQASGFGVSAEHAKQLYDLQLADSIRTQLLKVPGFQDVLVDALVTVNSGESNPFRLENNESKTSASIEVTLDHESVLSPVDVQAIAELVKDLVPDIDYDDITITDQNSNIVFSVGDGS